MKSFLFAYGTLQPDKAPPELRDLLKSMRSVGIGTAGGKLYDLGEFPAAIFHRGEKGIVRGTVFRLPENRSECDALLRKLDDYEGVDYADPSKSLFSRRRLPVSLRNGHSLNCWAYEYAGDPPKESPIFDGLYVGPRKNRRTSSRRFRSNPKVTQ